ncbi:MAG: hypothetical protein ABIE84_00140 [bacterium]
MSLPAKADLPQPVWQKLGKMINDTPGNTDQEKPKVIPSGNNYILIWEDRRDGFSDIYAQKINAQGTLLWTTTGLAVAPVSANQNFAQAVNDGAGGAIVVWQDYRNGNADIYAQRIGAAGDRLWGSTGVAISRAKAGQFSPTITADQQGGAIISWHDYRSGSGEDIYAQRIDSQGKSLWLEDGLAVATQKGTQWYPKIVGDGNGGAVITWTDGRVSPSDNNIYAQRLSAAGQLLWPAEGIAVCSAPNNQEHPVIISLAQEGVIIAWNDGRNHNLDIYVQKIDLDGQAVWTADGVSACKFDYTQESPQLAADGQGGAIITWTDHRSETTKIYSQRINTSGQPLWSDTGRALALAAGNQRNSVIIKLLNEEWVTIWEDERLGNKDLFAQKINSSGIPLWQKNGVILTNSSHKQQGISALLTTTGNVLVVFEDTRAGNSDIYGQLLANNGETIWAEQGLVLCNAPGAVVQQNTRAILTTQEEIILVFEDFRSGYSNIYAQKINKAGQLAWGEHGLAVAKVDAVQSKPRLIHDGVGGAIIAWEDYRNPDQPVIKAQRLSSFGKKQWKESLTVAAVNSRQTKPLLVSDDSGGAIIIWEDNRNILSLQDIYGQRVSRQGTPIWNEKGVKIISTNGNQVDAAVISDDLGGAIVAWTDYRNGDRNPDIYAQRINAQGKQVWEADGVAICSAPDVQRNVGLTEDRHGGAIIAWTDKGGGSYDIYAQSINNTGQVQWMKDGIPVNQLSRTQQNPKFGNSNILVWEDYRLGNWDIYAAEISSDGKLNWGEDGLPIAATSHTQYAPRTTRWHDNGTIVAWEDYRSGKSYEMYFQKIDSNGTVAWTENGVKVASRNGAKVSQIMADNSANTFFIFWEDFTNGGKAIYGQKYSVN